MLRSKKTSGFTLAEIVLSLAVGGVLLLIASQMLAIMLSANAKNQAIAEVDAQGLLAMQSMTQVIRNSQAINSPTQGNNDTTLSLDVLDVSNDPTLFYLTDNVLYIKEGSASAVPITNDRISLSNLTFTNLSGTGTPGTVQIQVDITYIDNAGRKEYDYSKTLTTSASLYLP